MSSDPKTICAFDVMPDGSVVPVDRLGPELSPEPAGAAAYRWLHFDLRDKGVAEWLAAHLPDQAGRTLASEETRPRVMAGPDGMVLTLRGINLNEGASAADMVAVRLWVTRSLVVTVRRRRIFAIDTLRKAAEAGKAPASPADFIVRLCDDLVARIEGVSLALEAETDEMEARIYDQGAEHLPDLAERRRSVIKLRRHVGPQNEALHRLATLETAVVPASLRDELADIANRATRSVEELAEVRERLTALSDHMELSQATRLGRNGYILSVIAAIFLPLGFLTGVFGVNLGGMPGASSPWGFAALCVGMAVIGVLLYVILRWRRWL